jgi:hypothetical protein
VSYLMTMSFNAVLLPDAVILPREGRVET